MRCIEGFFPSFRSDTCNSDFDLIYSRMLNRSSMKVVRMLFFDLVSPEEAIKRIDGITRPVDKEPAGLQEVIGRISAEDVISPVDLPPFDRSTMDGYAVVAGDTFGASPGLPAYLRLIGEVKMGEEPEITLSKGETVRIWTGGMLPKGADAVVMLEHTDLVGGDMVEVIRPVSPWENVIRRGDDVRKGGILLEKGRKVRPQDIAALAGAGITSISVYRRPLVAIIPTGDEIVPPEAELRPGRIRDMNSYSLAALCRLEGAEPVNFPIIGDLFHELKDALQKALRRSDMVLISGGSSVGARDVTLDVIDSLPDSMLHVHGISIRPGKPVIIATVGGKPVFGLPGNPVSAIICFVVFVRRAIARLSGRGEEMADKFGRIEAILKSNCPADPGRENYIPAQLEEEEGRVLALPLLGPSGIISILTRADGLIRIPAGVEGLEPGEKVEVIRI